MDSIRSVTRNCWNKCPSFSAFCPDSETPSRVAQCVKNIFSANSFSLIKDSKWTYVVLASAIVSLAIYKISQFRSNIVSLRGDNIITKEIESLRTEINKVKLLAEQEKDQLKEENKQLIANLQKHQEALSTQATASSAGAGTDEVGIFIQTAVAPFVTFCREKDLRVGVGAKNLKIPYEKIKDLLTAVKGLSESTRQRLFPALK